MIMRLASFLLVVVIAGTAHFFHIHSSRSASREIAITNEVRLFIPDGKSIRHFCLGQRTTLADLFWLKLVQYLGTPEAYRKGLHQLLPLAHLITDLDPEYGYAYMAAGLVLNSKKRVVESNEILEKGAQNSSRWEIPFYLAFNYWYELKDYIQGAHWLKKAALVPGRPTYITGLVQRLYSQAGTLDMAKQFTKAMLEETPSEEHRAELLQRLKELDIEEDLQKIERALAIFEKDKGRPAWSLEELIGIAPPHLLPFSPYHHSLQYDPLTQEVKSPLLEKRFALPKMEEPVIEAREK